ncbi:MAG: hypothetical protein KDA99_15715, partial [Planctomycetales bacterium]|nr:hypothetical protein [Planctomycetales bacterium]
PAGAKVWLASGSATSPPHPGPGGCDNDWRPSFQAVAPAGQADEGAKSDTGALQMDRGRGWRHPCVTKSQDDEMHAGCGSRVF